MKKLITSIVILLILQPLVAQNTASFELGSGINFTLNDGDYRFRLSGMIQPFAGIEKMGDQDVGITLAPKRTYFNISGWAVEQKVKFFVQTDFSTRDLLLDAWIAYNPIERLTITAGQKQTIANNREMLVMEDNLQFPDRSLLSTLFSNRGREFGLFVDAKLGSEKFSIVPQIALTSGDGINSFGVDSRDVDMGGMKYAARLDIYPFGEFAEGNDLMVADLLHEENIKMVLGGAASYNNGASQSVGEGHGLFMLYDLEGGTMLPDYRQLYYDLLVKYKGFSLLGEYVIATATGLEGTYLNEVASDALAPTEISEYLSLGRGLNAQLGYVTKNGYGVDFRYATVTPEFEENTASVIEATDAWTVGLSRYVKGQNLKLQLSFTSATNASDINTISGNFLVQIVL